MFCIVYELLYDNYMGITWQLYVKYKVITRMAFSQARCEVFAYGQKLHARQSENKFSLCSRLISFFPIYQDGLSSIIKSSDSARIDYQSWLTDRGACSP